METLIREIVAENFPWMRRIMVIEDGKPAEYFEVKPGDAGDLGTIFKGKVQKVLPTMQCAFVEIGQPKNAILYFSDLIGDKNLAPQKLKKGQDLLVQVLKQATGEKGARLTEEITLPGRLLVLMPYRDELRVSRKIVGDAEREEKRDYLKSLLPKGMGAIVRTACLSAAKEEIAAEVKSLLTEWEEIAKQAGQGKVPSVVHAEADEMERTLREYLDGTTKKITVNDEELFHRVENYAKLLPAEKRPKLHLQEGVLFEKLGLNKTVSHIADHRVWLKNGGFLVLDQTEAMMVIDVNSGKFTGKTSRDAFETMALQVNQEAAVEIARQIRLRGVGGMVLVDFIDMEKDESRAAVMETMQKALSVDKAHTRVLGFTALGLLEMTRHKTRRAALEEMTDICTICGGAGRVVSLKTWALNLKNALLASDYLEGSELICTLHPDLAEEIAKDAPDIQFIEKSLGKKITFNSDRERRWGDFLISSR